MTDPVKQERDKTFLLRMTASERELLTYLAKACRIPQRKILTDGLDLVSKARVQEAANKVQGEQSTPAALQQTSPTPTTNTKKRRVDSYMVPGLKEGLDTLLDDDNFLGRVEAAYSYCGDDPMEIVKRFIAEGSAEFMRKAMADFNSKM